MRSVCVCVWYQCEWKWEWKLVDADTYMQLSHFPMPHRLMRLLLDVWPMPVHRNIVLCPKRIFQLRRFLARCEWIQNHLQWSTYRRQHHLYTTSQCVKIWMKTKREEKKLRFFFLKFSLPFLISDFGKQVQRGNWMCSRSPCLIILSPLSYDFGTRASARFIRS